MAKSRRLRGRGVGTSKSKWELTPEQKKELAERRAKEAVEVDKLMARIGAQNATEAAEKARSDAKVADLSRRLAALRGVTAGRHKRSTRRRRQTKRR